MKSRVVILLAATVGFLGGLPVCAADVREREERAKLSGVWLGFTVEGRGETPDRGPVKVQLTITKEAMKGKQLKDGEVIDHGEGTHVLDLSKTPHVLDASKPRGRNNKDEWLGIYWLEGDTLKWCVRKKERPTEFATTDKAFLLILKRQKP